MLSHRIIPTLLCRGRALIKGKHFDSWRSCGVVTQAMRIHQLRGVDEVLLLDIGATPEGRGPDLAMVKEISRDCFFPLTVGGCIRGLDDARDLIRNGADKIAIGTAIFDHPEMIIPIARALGVQAVTAVIDVEAGEVWNPYRREHRGDPWVLAKFCEEFGAGELVVQSVDREGTMTGYDLELIHRISHAVNIPVVASGGCGTYEHMHEALEAGADAVAAGAMFQFTDQTPQGAAKYLESKGWEVRHAAIA